jgi:toxin-antitoxin system PIN domain toxin
VDSVDVNVLVYAFRSDATRHDVARPFIDNLVNGDEPFGLPSLVVSGFLRVVTLPASGVQPPDRQRALAFADSLLDSPNCRVLVPGPRHWAILRQLLDDTAAVANVIPDAYLAALAIESGCEFVTSDRGFGRFPGLRWRLLA